MSRKDRRLLVVLSFFVCLTGIQGESSDSVDFNVTTLYTESDISTATSLINTLSVTLLPSISVDIQVEISGRDATETDTYFTVWEEEALDDGGLNVENAGSPVLRASDTEPVYDGLYYDFGTVTNSGDDNMTMVVTFGAALVSYSAVGDGGDIKLNLGGDYDKGTFVWSDSLQFTIDIETVTPTYTITQTCTPETLEIDFFSLCTATFTTDDHYIDDMTIKVEVSNEDDLYFRSYSTANIREINRLGRHVPVPPPLPNTASYDAPDFYRTTATLSLGKVVKPGGSGSIIVEFALGTYKDNSRAGQAVQVKISILQDADEVGESTFYVNITEATRGLASLEVDMLSITMADQNVDGFSIVSKSGGFVYYDIVVNLTGKSNSEKFDFHLNLKPSDSGLQVGKIEVMDLGFNSPHVQEPELTKDHISGYTIYNTQQESNPDAASVTYRLTLSFFGVDESEASLAFTLDDGTVVSSTGTALLQISANNTSIVRRSFQSFWTDRISTYLEGNRACPVIVFIRLEANTVYRNLKVSMYPASTNVDVPVRMCNAYVSEMGKHFPTLYGQKNAIESSVQFKKRFNESYYPDGVEITIGDVTTTSDEFDDTANTISIILQMALPWGWPGKDLPPTYYDNSIYYYYVSVESDEGQILQTDREYYYLNNGVMRYIYSRTSSTIYLPTLEISANPSNVLRVNSPYIIVAKITIGPYMSHDLDFVIDPPPGIEICRPSLQQRGEDVGCVQGGDWYHGQRYSWHNSSRLLYDKLDNGVTNARLVFLGITNVHDVAITDKSSNRSSIYINIYLTPLQSFSGGTVHTYICDTYPLHTNVRDTADFVLGTPEAEITPTAPQGTTLSFTMFPSNFESGFVGVFDVEVKVPEGVSNSLTVTVSTTTSDASLCSAHVFFVGDLMPCVNGTLANFAYTSNWDSVTADLGRVCRTQGILVSDHVDPDIIRIRFAFIPTNPDAASLQFTGDIAYDGTPENLGVSSPEIFPNNNATQMSTALYTVTGAWFNVSALTVKDTRTVFFNVSIPRGTTSPFRAVLRSYPEEGRPSFILSNVRVDHAGRNVECSIVFVDSTMTVDFNSTRDEGDNDTAIVEIEVVTNTGFTELTYNDCPDDDIFTLAVDATLNDAEVNDHEATVYVEIQVTRGEDASTVSKLASVTVYRNVTEDLHPSLAYSVTHNYSEYYYPWDVATVAFRMSHLETSMAEPINVRLVMYLPVNGYLNLTATEISGRDVDVTLSDDRTMLTTWYTRMKFHDETEVIYNFTVNPDNRRDFGFRPYHMIVPYRFIMCIPPRHPVQYNILYPTYAEGCFVPEKNHFLVKMKNAECADDIQVDVSSIFPDCLFNASSVLDELHSPSNSRISSDPPWSPSASGAAEWIELDLVNLHFVSRLQHLPHQDYLQTQGLIIMVSDDGVKWKKADEVVLPQQDSLYEYPLETAVIARYIRFYIASSYGSGKPTGFRFNLLGCPVSDHRKASDVCTTAPTPPTKDDSGRAFVVDETNNVAYFCDYTGGRTSKTCYSSSDEGSTWKRSPWYVCDLKGFWPDTQSVFASSCGNSALFFTNDKGENWTPTTQVELDKASSSSTWVPSSVLIYDHSSSVTKGFWKANTDGVLYENQLVSSWTICCSAKIP